MTAETEIAPAPEAELGKARLRKEDERLITGQTNWTDNIKLPGMLHIAFVRSPFAHARITSVNVSAALAEPGVIAAYSGADFAAEQGSLPCAWPVTPDIVIPNHPPMATDEVRYVGEAVACVVARDRYAATDALNAIEVDYEPLPPVLDMRTALEDGSPKVHEAGNLSYDFLFTQGDMDTAFHDAPIVLERTYRQQRLIPAAMEPRAVVASCVGGEFTLWSATQIPHVLRVMLAMVTGIPEQNLRVIAPDVGGGFGSKLQVTAEEVLAVLIARKLGRPVKWTESRSEGNLTVHHGRDQWQQLRIAADSDGRIRGLEVDLLADMGAYLMLVTPGVPVLGAFMFPGIYKMDAYSFRCRGVFTTKMPTDAYRGAGRPEATFAIERLMDELATELGLDPLEVRERNWIKHEEFPYTTVAGLTYDSGNYEAATAKAKDLFGYEALRREQQQRRTNGDPVQLGLGVSTFTEMCGLAPSRVLGSLAYGAGGWEQASIRMLPTGKVEVVTGSSAHGQGHETAWSQIVADQLGVPFEDIRVLHGDTQVSPRGMDTYGSRSLAVGGMALVMACDKVIDKARRNRRGHARGLSSGPGVDTGTLGGSRRPGQGRDDRRDRPGHVRRACSARGRRAEHRRRRHLRPGKLLLPAWHPSVRDRGRHRDRLCEDPLLCGRRRHRQGRQPADRRGPGARRSRPGHRAGPVRGSGARRRGQPDHHHAGRLPDPVGHRPAVLHHRADREPSR